MTRRLILLACLAAGLWAAAPARADAGAPSEAQLRAFEEEVLGPEHAAEHAQARAYARSADAEESASTRAITPTASGNPALDGRWGPSFKIPVIAVHAVMLPTGKVMWFSYPRNAARDVGDPNAPNTAQAWLWDPANGDVERVDPPDFRDPVDGKLKPANIWCAAQGLTADGRVVVVGGNLDYTTEDGNFKGLDMVFTFNPWNETWTRQPDMNHGRWYPSEVLLPDGRMLIIGGLDETGDEYSPNLEIELFTPSDDLDGVGTLTPLGMRGGPGDPPDGGLYPHLFQMPSGRVLVAGPNMSDSWAIEPLGLGTTLAWTDFADQSVRRLWGSAVLVPDGPDGSTVVQQLGGSDPTEMPGEPVQGGEATATTEQLDESDLGAGWQPAAPMQVPRSHLNTVLLPDGSMVTVGGGIGRNRQHSQWAVTGAERQIEIFDPAAGTWRLGAVQAESRAYHSTALLLPDGRVLSAGDDYNGKNGPASGLDNDTAEIYEPPYLFEPGGGYAARPTISAAPASVQYGEQFFVQTFDADVASASLVAPAATTHANDMNQRVIPLELSQGAGGVSLTAPAAGTIAPPGWHMLFLVNSAGVPSVARWVLLGEDPPLLGRIEITARIQDGPAGARMRLAGAPFRGMELADGEMRSASVPGGPSTTVAGGHYTVGLARDAGYLPVAAECDDPATEAVGSGVRIHLSAGEVVRCTITGRALADGRPVPPPVEPGDAAGPTIRFSARRGLGRRRRVLRGRASDPGSVRRVDVALARSPRRARRCGWLLPGRGASVRRRSCRKPLWTRARLTGRGPVVRWRLPLGRVLPPGRYSLRVRSVDGLGNRAYWPRRSGSYLLRVHRSRR